MSTSLLDTIPRIDAKRAEKIIKTIDERYPRERDKVNSFIALVREVVALNDDSKTFL